ncbi:sulfite exporter TauE/SafE family protein [[Pseudomonas] carboxydohydrogena]|nr:sulfite exporter TauE/SafE family protein [[Pseudomonas] carboxydohydrogena]
MIDPILIAIALVFMLAGFVKGVIGMGLPTVAIGLLATRMPPAHAIAIVIGPAIITNLWQTFGGPYFFRIVRRLWPLLLACCLGVWSGADFLSGPFAPYGTILLGLLLIVYSVISLRRPQFHVAKGKEGWIGAICGYLSGLIAAATGVQVIPAMPFIHALGMERDEFIQALGVFFTTSTVAMLFNLRSGGFLTADIALPATLGLIAALIGMYLGQVLRLRMPPETFRRWFLYSMIALGAYLAIDKIVQLNLI